MSIVAIVVFSGLIYVLLVAYTISTWRHFRGRPAGAITFRDILKRAILFGGIWLLLMLLLLTPWALTGLIPDPRVRLLIDVIVFIPVLPIYPGMLLALVAEPIAVGNAVALTSAWVVGTTFSAVLILVSVAYIELLLLRAKHATA
jgi:hypothetical protein